MHVYAKCILKSKKSKKNWSLKSKINHFPKFTHSTGYTAFIYGVFVNFETKSEMLVFWCVAYVNISKPHKTKDRRWRCALQSHSNHCSCGCSLILI